MNQVLLRGNIGKNIKVIEKKNSPTLIMFSIATHETFKNKNGDIQTKTSWVNTKAFGKVADEAKSLKTGDYIFIDGKISNERWIEPNSKEEHYYQSVYINEFLLLKSKPVKDNAFENIPF